MLRVCTSDTMDGQQVFVTGADGEQMVLSGPEAAALLAQAGISLGDQDQVMMGEGGELDPGQAPVNPQASSFCQLYSN